MPHSFNDTLPQHNNELNTRHAKQ